MYFCDKAVIMAFSCRRSSKPGNYNLMTFYQWDTKKEHSHGKIVEISTESEFWTKKGLLN